MFLGASVVVKASQPAVSGATVLPEFAVRSMMRTFGLTGTVLEVDQVFIRNIP